MRFSSGFASAPFSSACIASNAFFMAGAIRVRKASLNAMRLTSTVRSMEGATQRVSLYRFQNSPAFMFFRPSPKTAAETPRHGEDFFLGPSALRLRVSAAASGAGSGEDGLALGLQ